jgi:hypothetical protein
MDTKRRILFTVLINQLSSLLWRLPWAHGTFLTIQEILHRGNVTTKAGHLTIS